MNSFHCPFPIDEYPYIVLAHGGGGRLMKHLLDDLILPILEGGPSGQVPLQHDAAVLDFNERVAMTTDSFVVDPLVFPGGDIGCLSVYGTVNDLAMIGAVPKAISVALIMEEGLPTALLRTILTSLRRAADKACVTIVTGDTKVVEHGKGDRLYINTTGVGSVAKTTSINPSRIQIGDRILVSGDLGRHGVAVMAKREGLNFDSLIESDCGPLHTTVLALLNLGLDLHCLRDITRGGLSSALNELAESSDLSFQLYETKIPLDPSVRSICEVFGLDPFYVACEGRFVAVVPQKDVDAVLDQLKIGNPTAALIGEVLAKDSVSVWMKNAYGSKRVLSMLSGEQLPRIC